MPLKNLMIDNDHLEALVANLSPETKHLFRNEISLSIASPKGRRCTDEIKVFADTLHLYSPQVYEFIREGGGGGAR